MNPDPPGDAETRIRPASSPATQAGARSFYAPGAQRAERVGDLFAEVATRYDLINDLQSLGLHRLWKRRLVRLARLGPGRRALDVCCGTGDVTFALGRTGAEVVGVDFSAPMLSVARRRAAAFERRTRASARPSLRFLEADAQELPFEAGSFDAVTISYGLRNLADPGRGLAEMWRVTRPGGRLLVLDFGKPENRGWRAAYYTYLRRLVPVWGRLVCGNAAAYGYILESLERYAAQAGVARMLRELGAADVQIINLLGGAMSIHDAGRA